VVGGIPVLEGRKIMQGQHRDIQQEQTEQDYQCKVEYYFLFLA